MGRAPERLRGWGTEVGLPTLFNRKDLIMAVYISDFSLELLYRWYLAALPAVKYRWASRFGLDQC